MTQKWAVLSSRGGFITNVGFLVSPFATEARLFKTKKEAREAAKQIMNFLDWEGFDNIVKLDAEIHNGKMGDCS